MCCQETFYNGVVKLKPFCQALSLSPKVHNKSNSQNLDQVISASVKLQKKNAAFLHGFKRRGSRAELKFYGPISNIMRFRKLQKDVSTIRYMNT